MSECFFCGRTNVNECDDMCPNRPTPKSAATEGEGSDGWRELNIGGGDALTRATESEIGPPTPLGALKFRMEQGGYTQADFARVIGHRAHASEILAGKRQLSKAHIAALADTWGIPARSLLGPDATNWKARALTAEDRLRTADARVIELEREVAKLRRIMATPTGDA